MPSPFLRRFVAALFCSFLLASVAFAQIAPERIPPEVYERAIAPLLTPLADVLAGRTAFPESTDHGVTLLAESIHFRDDDGTYYRVYHDVYFAHDDGAIESLGSNTYSYDKRRESLFLIDAATILPDGTRREIDSRGAFLQAPQHEAANGLYTSDEELTVVFPAVAVGASTSAIVLIRENDPVFPGEFAAAQSFQGGWPRFLTRLVVDLPTPAMDRLHFVAAHPSVPTSSTTSDASSDRSRQIWESHLMPELPWEEGGPGFLFRAPTLWITSLDSWDQIAAWYDQLLDGRDELGADLSAQLDQWTQGLSDQRDIVRAVFDHVANDVRYTGLEFGLAGYQPYPCADVWANRYGDCKDKANLFRALLRAKGIESHLVLLNTNAHGRIERRSPSWHQFNHAILAIRRPTNDGFDFVDPTIEQIDPDFIGYADSDRDVIVITDDHANWVRTPINTKGRVHASGQLDLKSDGELSGWFEFTVDGSDASFYAQYYNTRDPQHRLTAAGDLVKIYFPGAETLDLDYQPTTGAIAHFQLRAFFIRPSNQASGATIGFPYPVSWLPELTTSGVRKLDYHTLPRTESVDFTINLPEQVHAPRLPSPFNADSPTAAFSADWRHTDRTLSARLSWKPNAAFFKPAEYLVMQRATRALTTWLESTISIEIDPTATAAESDALAIAKSPPDQVADSDNVTLENFPILATGEGQMRLLAERFPEGRDNVRRRLALERVQQWFPGDIDTMFDSSVFLILLDCADAWDARFVTRLQEVLTRLGGRAAPSSVSWAEYLLARGMWLANHDPAGIQKLRALATDSNNSAYRRGWSAFQAANYLSESDPTAARTLLVDFDQLDCDARETIAGLHARLLASQADAEPIRQWFERLRSSTGSDLDAILAAALDDLFENSANESTASLTLFTDSIGELIAPSADFPTAATALSKLTDRLDQDRAWSAFYAEIPTIINRHKTLEWLTPGDAHTWPDATALEAELDRANGAHDAPAILNGALNFLQFHHEDLNLVRRYIRWTIWWLRSQRLDDDLLIDLGKCALKMPPSNDSEHVSAWREYARALSEIGQPAQAVAINQQILTIPDLRDYQAAQTHASLCKLALADHDFETAYAEVQALAPLQATHTDGADFLFPGIQMAVARGDYDQALEWLNAGLATEAKYLDQCVYKSAYEALKPLNENPAALKAYWEFTQTWWPAWEALLTVHGVEPVSHLLAAELSNITTIETQIAEAAKENDDAKVLSGLNDLVHLAAAIPSGIVNFGNKMEENKETNPALNHALREWFLTATRDFPTVDNESRQLVRRRAGYIYYFEKRTEDVAAWAPTVAAECGWTSPHSAYAAMLWLDLTKGTANVAPALAFALHVLETDQSDFRPTLVGQVHDELLAQGRSADRLALILRELEQPSIQANASLKQALEGQREQLRHATQQAADITEFIDGWLKRHDFAWLKFLPPNSLDAPDVPAPNNQGYFDQTNIDVKSLLRYNLLVALDPDRLTDARMGAFGHLIFSLSTFTGANQIAAAASDALAVDYWPLPRRLMLVSQLSYLFSVNGDADLAKALLTQPLNAKYLPQRFTDLIAAVPEASAGSRGTTVEELTTAFRTMISRPWQEGDPVIAMVMLQHLVYLGADDEIKDLLRESAKIQIGDSLQQTVASMRLQWTRFVRDQQSVRPLFLAVRDALKPLYPYQPEDVATLLDRNSVLSFALLPEKDQLRMITAGFVEGHFSMVGPEELFVALCNVHYVSIAHPELSPPLIDLLLNAPIEDSARAQYLGSLFSITDPDVENVRTSVQASSRAFLAKSNRTNDPLTRSLLRRMLASQSIRYAVDEAPPELFDPEVREELGAGQTDLLQFQFFASHGRYPEALTCLRRIPEIQLTSAHYFPYVKRVLHAQNLDDEADLMQEVALESLEDDQNWLLVQPNPQLISQVFAVLETAGQLDAFDSPFFQHLAERTTDPVTRAYLNFYQAIAHRDWPAVIKFSEPVLDYSPELFTAIGRRGEAYAQLGDFAAARRDLTTYLKFERSHARYPEIRALFDSLPLSP